MTNPDPQSARSVGARHWLLRDLPYAAMLALAMGGLVLTGFRSPTTYYYWMALAPIYGLITVISGWRQIETTAEHLQLVVTQVLSPNDEYKATRKPPISDGTVAV